MRFNERLRLAFYVILISVMVIFSFACEGEFGSGGNGGTAESFYSQSPMKGWISRNVPVGYYLNNKTYIFFQGIDYHPRAIYYNHTTNTWSSSYQIGTSPLIDNSHGTPTVVRDSTNHIHVFYGCHNSYIQHAKSTNTDNITAWTDKGDIGDASSTYPCPVLLNNGNIYIFARKTITSRKVTYFIKSTNNGENWTSPTNIIDFGDLYWMYHSDIKYDSTNNRIHLILFANHREEGIGKYRNIYHVYFDPLTSKLYSMDGTDLGTSITKSVADANCKIFDSASYSSWAGRLQLDSNNYPYVIFSYSATDDHRTGTTPSNFNYKFMRWDGSSWTTPVNITNAQIGYGNDFYIKDDSEIRVYLGNSQIDNEIHAGRIEEWGSFDMGASWNKIHTVYNDNDGGMETIHCIKDFDDDLKMVFSQRGDEVSNKRCYAYVVGITMRSKFVLLIESACSSDFL